jgi:hypothetical protein
MRRVEPGDPSAALQSNEGCLACGLVTVLVLIAGSAAGILLAYVLLKSIWVFGLLVIALIVFGVLHRRRRRR